GRERQIFLLTFFDRVADFEPFAARTRDSALDQQQIIGRIHGNDFEVLRRDARRTHVAGHALAFEDFARLLALTGRTVRAVRHGNTVRRAQTAETVTLDTAGETFTGRDAGDVDELARHEMRSRKLGADFKQRFLRHAELANDRFGFDLGFRQVALQRLGDVLRLAGSGAQLHGGITVALGRADIRHLVCFTLQYGDRH